MDFAISLDKKISQLLKRIDEQQEPIDCFLQNQIIHRLNSYLLQIEGNTHNKTLQEKHNALIHKLQEAKYRISQLPATETFSINSLINKNKGEIENMVNEINNIRSKVELYKITSQDLKRFIYYAQCIATYKPKKVFEYSNILLDMFLNSEPSQVSKLLEFFLQQLEKIYNYISSTNFWQFVNLENNTVIEILKKILSIITNTKDKTELALTQLQGTSEKIKTDLDSFDFTLRNITLPLSSSKLEAITNDLNIIKDELTRTPTENSIGQETKKQYLTRIDSLLANFTKLEKTDSFLTETQNQIFDTVNSFIKFENKLNILKAKLKEVQEISTLNQNLKNKQEKLILEISALIASEKLNFLKQKLQLAENFISYAKQFSFTRLNKMYQIKKEEMYDLKQSLSSFSKENFLSVRIAAIENKIRKGLDILEEKATENAKIIGDLQELKKIEDGISNQNYQLQDFNIWRNKIQNLSNSNYKLNSKKLEVLKKFHEIEKSIYKNNFPELASITANLIEEYQNLTYRYLYDKNIKDYEVKDTEIKALLQQLLNLASNKEEKEHLQNAFENFSREFNLVFSNINNLKLALYTTSIYEDEIKSIKDNTNSSNLHKIYEEFQSVKKLHLTNTFKVKILEIEEKFKVELNKEKIKNIISKINFLGKNQENITLEKIYELLDLKTSIEDMLEEDSELAEYKTIAIRKLKLIVKFSDPELASVLFINKVMESVDLEKYFSDVENIPIQNKNSGEYVQYIRKTAESLEIDVNYFLGTKESTDFFIIDDKLMRLLEKLDSIKSTDEKFEDEIVETTLYVKSLKKILASNAYTEQANNESNL